MRRRDWVLAVLGAAKGEAVTPVQLQKALFLLEKECPQIGRRSYYHFAPYAYGPFDSTIYTDAEELAAEGVVAITPSEYGPRVYRATEAGVSRAERLPPDASIQEAVHRIVAYVRSLSFQQLVAAIYRKYPEMRVNSVFR